VAENQVESDSPSKKKSGTIKLLYLLLIPILILATNLVFTLIPNTIKLNEDSRNERVKVLTYQRYGIMPNQLVIDIWGIDDEASMADVTRTVFNIAERMQNRNYDWVVLSHKGKAKLKIDGNFFAETGETFEYQNPVYLVRTLPSEVYEMDGTKAYGTWTGGLLGVVGKQMEDHNKLHEDWYLNDMRYRY